MKRRIILAGGSGFLGQMLVRHFATCGDEVVLLTRKPSGESAVREVAWDGENLGAWAQELEGADAVINLV